MKRRWIVQVCEGEQGWRDVHEGEHVTPAAHAYMDAPEPKRWLLNGRVFAFAPVPEPDEDRPALPYKED